MSEAISSQSSELNSQRIYLHVPYAQKDAAKQLGAEWNGKQWFIPPGIKPDAFSQWLPVERSVKQKATVMMASKWECHHHSSSLLWIDRH